MAVEGHASEEELEYEEFYTGVRAHFEQEGYFVEDEATFRSLMHTFYEVSKKEHAALRSLHHEDQLREVELTERALREYNMKGHGQAPAQQTALHRFSVIRDRIVTPILLAKEQLLECADKGDGRLEENKEEEVTDSSSHAREVEGIQRRLASSSLENEERRMLRKRPYRRLQRSKEEIAVSTSLLGRATDAV